MIGIDEVGIHLNKDGYLMMEPIAEKTIKTRNEKNLFYITNCYFHNRLL
jgi:hypothetical protein